MKLTRQGVRDLGGNNVRPVVQKLDNVPAKYRVGACDHTRLAEDQGFTICEDCGAQYLYDPETRTHTWEKP